MPEDTIRFTYRTSKKNHDLINSLWPLDNCKSQNEFIDKAIEFYAGFLSAQNATEFLAKVFVSVMQGTVLDSETRIKRMLFKLSTELGLLTRIVASYEGLDANSLHSLRGQVVDDLKHTNGTLQLDEAVRRHQAGR